MTWTPYRGDAYLNFPETEAWCRALASAHPEWFRIEEIGKSRHKRSIFLLTVGEQSSDLDSRPGFWLDGGTHAAEWTGVMAVVHTLSRWAERLSSGDPETVRLFQSRTAYVVPCISPDGFQALCEGAPFIRSTLREQPEGCHHSGLRPKDMTGDGAVRWMRWKHPAGPWMEEPDTPIRMRHRTLNDAPEDAFFLCNEGVFEHWDGSKWCDAPREYGIDLNRNFPGSWAPFRMFGMDGGAYPLSEPESRAVVDAVHARPNIAVALTNHTYTGCILTQPYRDPSPLSQPDIDLFEALAASAVTGTGYRVIKVHPDFVYDPKKAIVGVWSDTLSTTFGIPGYTLELWDPYGFAGVSIEKPAEFFRNPDPKLIGKLFQAFTKDPEAVHEWEEFDHPQLGPVQIGGLDYMRTIRNPPVAYLPAEVGKGATVADRLLQSTPDLRVSLHTREEGDVTIVEALFQNLGFLPTAASAHAEEIEAAPPIRVTLETDEKITCIDGDDIQIIGHLDGWGSLQVGPARHGIYSGLGARGPRARAKWVLRGTGTVRIAWTASRAGSGSVSTNI